MATIDEQMQRLEELGREIAAVPQQIETLKANVKGMETERRSIQEDLRKRIGSALHLRTRAPRTAAPAKGGRKRAAPASQPSAPDPAE